MTKAQKVRVMFAVLDCALLPNQRPKFQEHVKNPNPDALWNHYANSMRKNAQLDSELEAEGKISFRMLEPIMKSCNDLRPTD